MSEGARYIGRRRRPRGGTAPGTMNVDPDALAPVLRVLAYGPDGCQERVVKQLSALQELREAFPVVWLNIDGLGDETVVRKIGEMFNLHPLALADAVHPTQRPKVERYEQHAFFVTRMVTVGDRITSEQISLFLGEGFIVTFQERPGDCLDPIRHRIRKKLGRICSEGADYLAYAIIDALVDHFFPILEQYGERLARLEEDVIQRSDSQMIRQIHGSKRDLLQLRRVVWPLREALSSILRDDVPRMGTGVRLYMRDCYDHVTQILDTLETYRELASGLLDAYLTSASNRMNEVMKVLTIIATIFIPLTFVVGVYGMNFQHMVPANESRWGYPVVLLVMAAMAAGMFAYFRKRGWLGGGGRRDS